MTKKNGSPQKFQRQLKGMSDEEFLNSYNKTKREENVLRGCFYGSIGSLIIVTTIYILFKHVF